MKIRDWMRTCIACPSQWDLTDVEGGRWYVRFRWGHLSLNPWLGEELGGEVLMRELSHPLDGWLSNEQMMAELADLFDFSEAVELPWPSVPTEESWS